MYELSEETKRNINMEFKRKLGITYNEYEQLDCDEQRKLICEYHKKNKIGKKDEVTVLIGSGEDAIITKAKKGALVMIGSGEDSCFVRAGITPEEAKRELDDKLDEVLYSKPVALVKKLGRRLKK